MNEKRGNDELFLLGASFAYEVFFWGGGGGDWNYLCLLLPRPKLMFSSLSLKADMKQNLIIVIEWNHDFSGRCIQEQEDHHVP